MKIILGIIIFFIFTSFAVLLLPLAIGLLVAVFKFQSGEILGGIISIIIGLLCEIAWWLIISGGEIQAGRADEDCPYCGSGDTDGNHCYTCDDDF